MPHENDPHLISSASEKTLAYRRKIYLAMTPSERLELSERLCQQAFATMRSNPVAWQAFVKRNHHQRRAGNVARLVAEMKQERGEEHGG